MKTVRQDFEFHEALADFREQDEREMKVCEKCKKQKNASRSLHIAHKEKPL